MHNLKSKHGRGAGFSTPLEPTTLKCPKCNSNHWLSRCDKFKGQSLEDRQKLVREKKLCNNCLLTGHFVRACPKKSFCKVEKCTNKHSTFLHPKQNQPSPINKPGDSKDEKEISKSPTRGKNVDQSVRLFTFCALGQSDCVKFAKRKQKERGNSILL